MITPHMLFKKIAHHPFSFFLDSSLVEERLGRFSYIGCEPFLVFKSKKDSITLEWADGRVEYKRDNPFLALKDLFKTFYSPGCTGRGCKWAGAGVGYFGYDMKDFIEELPDRAKDDIGIPDCIIGFYDAVMVCDHVDGRIYIETVKLPGLPGTGAADILKEVISSASLNEDKDYCMNACQLSSDFSKDEYIKTINRAKEYIRNGDIYQVNLSQRFEGNLHMDPYGLYLRLRDFSPAPFSSYLNFQDVKIISSSPERFLFKKGSYIETRPIKGTRPRGQDIFSDKLNETELFKSEKDRAEHIMIVDLERNDLGRICEFGSVLPSEFISLEKYSTVFHLVSTVSGRLKKGIDAIDCLLATFPGGSITGAPKIRSMQIIEELEPVKRSVYTGAIGYISFDGNMDTSIVIRTILVKDNKIYFHVGGGIVADSDPEKEYRETLDKAAGIMRALNEDKVYA